jgi:hypothetical protein
MNTCTNNPHTVTEFDISGLEAMLAGTLCLMSAYSHCNCANASASVNENINNQGLIGLKIVSNLTCLQYQNSLSAEFRKVLSKVCESWRQHSMLVSSEPQQVGLANGVSPAAQASHWHAAPSTVQ